MKYLTDTEILNWNKRLEKSDYKVYPISNMRSGEPDIIFRQKVTNHHLLEQFDEIMEPYIRYEFTFSVASNRKSDFFDLFEKLSKEEFGTKSILREQTHNYRNLPSNDKVCDIPFNESIVERKSENRHVIYDKEYIRYTYHFAGKLGSIMAYISYLEDAINFFSEIWGYKEDASEVCLLKYPIGTIVSLSKDKSKDYLVLDYKYRKNGKYYIDFIISEMLNNKGSVIKYGEILTVSEDLLCYSRSSRIDDILN
jgi:hypothetical protein